MIITSNTKQNLDLDYVELHLHSQGSLNDGGMTVPTLVQRAKELGWKSVALTEHGKMYLLVEFYKACIEAGIKPIIGEEIYVVPDGKALTQKVEGKKYYHMILLAKNLEGYKELCRATRIAERQKIRGKPCLTDEQLKYFFGHGNIIASSACIGGEIQQHLLNGEYQKAKERAFFYYRLFKKNFFMELQYHGIEEQLSILPTQIQLAKELHIPTVITNDSHFARKEDKKTHDLILCLQYQKKLHELKTAYTEHHYMKGSDEIYEMFAGIISGSDIKEAMANTIKIADMCNVELPLGEAHYPKFPLPQSTNVDDFLRESVFDKLSERVKGFDVMSMERRAIIIDRIEFELDVIKKTGYSDYFCIVADVLDFVRSIGGYVGLGRGSGAGSIVAYILGIVNLNPLDYGLYFDRFLNLERVSAPDFDLDIDDLRDRMKQYTIDKYGEDKVVHIITFGTMAARGSIRDVGRILDVDLSFVDKIAKLVPADPGVTLKKALGIEKDKEGKVYEQFYSDGLREAYETDPHAKELLTHAMKLEGFIRQTGTHAAAIIISDIPVHEYMPVEYDDENGVWRSQYSKDYCEEMGALKMDYLGLNTLTIIKNTAKLIKERHGIELDHDKIIELALNDKDIIREIYAKGKTVQVFQFESVGMRNMLMSFNPQTVYDLILMNACYRPGPLKYIPFITANKNSPSAIKYDCEALKPILEETYGYPVYQETVMAIFRTICNYSLGKADIIRRSMGKKKIKDLLKAKDDFIEGCLRNGMLQARAEAFFEELMDFSAYAFNKSHSAAYTITSLETAWLKYHYPVEYMCSCLTYCSTTEQLPSILNEVKNMGIEILPPDINLSGVNFMPVGENAIRFGLSSVKNVGNSATEIVKGQPYRTMMDFLDSLVDFSDTNKQVIESLAHAGCFEGFGYNRKSIIDSVDLFAKYKTSKKKQARGQIDLFSMLSVEENLSTINIRRVSEFDYNVKLEKEREVLNCYVTGHPLNPYKYLYNFIRSPIYISDISEEQHNNEFNIIGRIKNFQLKNRKSDGKPMCRFTIEDLTGEFDAICFTGPYEKFNRYLYEGSIKSFNVKVQFSEENKQLIIVNVGDIQSINKEFISLKSKGDMKKLERLPRSNHAYTKLFAYIEDENKIYEHNVPIELNEVIYDFFEKENISV